MTVRTIRIGLDEAFRYAVTLAWKNLMKVSEPRSVVVEYFCQSETALDHLRVWLVKERGYRDLVCDYWTSSSPFHPSGACFRNAHTSETLAHSLSFITENQELFTRAKDCGDHGLILIYPPDAKNLTGAATWMTVVKVFAAALAANRLNDRRSIGVSCAQMDSEAHPNQRVGVPDNRIPGRESHAALLVV